MRSSSIPLNSVLKVYGIFSNRKLPSISKGKPWVTAIPYTALRDSWSLLTNHLKRGFSCLVLKSLLNSLWFLCGKLVTSFKLYTLYINIHLNILYIILGQYKVVRFLIAFRNKFINTSLFPFLFWSSTHKQKPLPISAISPFISPISGFSKIQVKEKNETNGLEC